MTTLPSVFATTIQKSALWLHEIEEDTGWDEQRAYRALRATLHVLRDRLTVDQAAHLGAQLPMMVRGFYYEGWHPAGVPDKRISSRQDFVDCVGSACHDTQIDAERAVAAVLRVLSRHVSPGEIRKLRDQLPKAIAALLPEPPAGAPAASDFVAGPDGVRAMH